MQGGHMSAELALRGAMNKQGLPCVRAGEERQRNTHLKMDEVLSAPRVSGLRGGAEN